MEPAHAFHFLPPADIVGVLAATVKVCLRKGETLFDKGDEAKAVYFIEKGKLAVLQETGFNGRAQVVAVLEPGACVGEGAIADERGLRSSTLQAIEEAELYRLDKVSLFALADKNSQTVIRILNRLLYSSHLRLQKASERLAQVL